jgi:hypothetical protein
LADHEAAATLAASAILENENKKAKNENEKANNRPSATTNH